MGTFAMDIIKKQQNNKSKMDKIRILFLKAHQDLISNNINRAKSQLFETQSFCLKSKQYKRQSIAFLNNMSYIFALNDECGSAMSLIHRALSLHASFCDASPLYSSDYIISYLCYNAGLYLQNLGQFARSLDSFLCCLPVLQSKPRLWLRMAQCVLAIWEPFGGFEWNKDGQPQINSLLHDLIEADSTKRGNLYLLPIGRKSLFYNDRDRDNEELPDQI